MNAKTLKKFFKFKGTYFYFKSRKFSAQMYFSNFTQDKNDFIIIGLHIRYFPTSDLSVIGTLNPVKHASNQNAFERTNIKQMPLGTGN